MTEVTTAETVPIVELPVDGPKWGGNRVFQPGVSGNPAGRPKGSKNKVTLLKLLAEEAVREQNLDAMMRVARLVITQALDGHEASQKLVWDAIMSKGSVDDRTQAQEKVAITINTAPKEAITVIETPPVEENSNE